MPAARRSLGALVTAVVLVLGVIALPVGAADLDGGTPARVVVAAIDTGMNPYHEFFHHGGEGPYADVAPSAVTQAVLDEFGIGQNQIIRVTRTGNHRRDVQTDAAQWEQVERGKPYWFEGTNVIGISFSNNRPLEPHRDKNAHGVGVTAAVLEANPEAIVVMVEGTTGSSEEWAFTHPAVDMVTTSYGPIGSPPLPWHLSNSYTGVVTNGKLHFGAVDNTPALSPIDTTGGPWWSIGVAGFQEEGNRGRQLSSGTFADFLGNFTQSLPYCMDCESGRSSVSGTSFATPTSAGTTSSALLEARRAAGHAGGIVTDGENRPQMVAAGGVELTNWEVRRALEEAAAYPTTAEYNPGEGSTFDATAAPIPDAAPWSVAGWGLISPDPERQVVSELLAHLGVAGEPTRAKDAATCAFMTAQIEARYAYWNNYAFMGESFGATDDPYIRCG